MLKAKITDIFNSIQGEGKYLGENQCFIRFFDCNLKCNFCDTKQNSYKKYSVTGLLEQIEKNVDKKKIKTVSITGGEPLLQRDFLSRFLPRLRRRGFKTYLETNGILHDELFDIIDDTDIIAMDIKLPSSTKQKALWKRHAEFLKVAKNQDVFVKTIICSGTTLTDLKTAVRLVSKINPDITFVLQPNTDHLGHELTDKLQEFKKYSKKHLSDVRAIPQLHKMIGVK